MSNDKDLQEMAHRLKIATLDRSYLEWRIAKNRGQQLLHDAEMEDFLVSDTLVDAYHEACVMCLFYSLELEYQGAQMCYPRPMGVTQAEQRRGNA